MTRKRRHERKGMGEEKDKKRGIMACIYHWKTWETLEQGVAMRSKIHFCGKRESGNERRGLVAGKKRKACTVSWCR